MTETLGFWVAAVVLVAASLAVVLTPNLFHAVLWLAAALVATGGVFLLLDSPFLLGVQLLLYAGCVVTIVVFAIMLTERLVGESIRQTSRFVLNGAVLAAAVFVGILGFLLQAGAVTRPAAVGDQLGDLGPALVGPFAAPLQLLCVLLVIGLPFASFMTIGLIRPLRRRGRPAAAVSILAMAGAFLTAGAMSWQGIPVARGLNPAVLWSWLPADGGPMASVGVWVDGMAMQMCVLVTLVSLLVQVYSWSYLADEPPPSLGRYYAYQSLFAFSMLGLVLSPGFLQMFVFWELVGLCSYLLIGYWYDRPSAAQAAVKAFWITKLGDLGFVAGIVMLWSGTGTFDFWPLFQAAEGGALHVDGLTTIMFLIYLGAVGKSAQFPLHVWLPDAMEGPTPVSALIHAATMVTAGVYMVARAYPLFALVPSVLTLIAWVGAFTALLAATMACVEPDIKRVLAYSTVSQLGYMMAANGAGAPEAAL